MTQSKPSESEINMNELDITLDLTHMNGIVDTITIDTSTMNDYIVNINDYVADTIDISSIGISDINVDWQHISNITLDRVMFEDDMPDPQEIKRMCEEYPALEKVYENFKTVYKMVEQDWRGKNKADDDEFPF